MLQIKCSISYPFRWLLRMRVWRISNHTTLSSLFSWDGSIIKNPGIKYRACSARVICNHRPPHPTLPTGNGTCITPCKIQVDRVFWWNSQFISTKCTFTSKTDLQVIEGYWKFFSMIVYRFNLVSLFKCGGINGPRQANLCLRAFRHDKFYLRMPSHSEGPGIWFSVWRFLLTHCLYERERRFWRDCADAQARLNLRCSHRR